MNPMTYEIIRTNEKRRLAMRPSYSVQQFNYDFGILMKLYRLGKTQRVDRDIDVYFKIKFFRQLEKIPFINPIPYMNLQNGLDLAVKDVSTASFSYFFI